MVLSSIANFSIFHDARIGKIYYDYGLKSIVVDLLMDSSACNGQAVLKGSNVSYAQFQSSEPWGQGIYVESLEYKSNNESQEITILLNSGDSFHIIAKLFEFL